MPEQTASPDMILTIKNGESYEMGCELKKKTILELSEINVENEESIFFPEGKKFVHSFDLSKGDNEQIFAFTNRKEREEGYDPVSVRGKAFLNEGIIKIEGEGFVSIVLRIYEYSDTKVKE